jgi:uncharacterized protein YjiS (DUF1127 family)
MSARPATMAFQGRSQSVSGTDIWSALKRRWSQRRTMLMLADLDDHTLRDIGLDRSQIGRPRHSMSDWVVGTATGRAQIAFIGR